MTPNNFRVKSGLTVGTTISGGNTTITGFVNATSTVNAAGLAVGTSFVANTTRVVIGTAVGLQANGGIGSAGQVLHSNGTTVYWDTDDQGVTSVASGNGITGGTITSTGTLYAVGGSTMTINTTGIHVNTANLSIATSQLTGDVALGTNTSGNYVATISNANGISGSSSTEGGTPTIGVVTGSTLTVNTTGIHVNQALSITDLVLSGNLTVSGTRTYVNTTTLDVGDNMVTLNADLGAVAPTQDAGIEVMRGTSANVQFMWDETNDRWSTNGQSLAVSTLVVGGTSLNSTVWAGTANNADYLDGQHGSYYTNATNITTGTLPYAQIPANVINTTANFTISGVHTHSANIAMGNNNIINPVFTGYSETEVANTAATGTWTMDCAAANFFELTLTGSITISPSNVPASTRMWSGTIVAKQDATGGRTITWPSGIKWPGGSAPPATTTANAIDIWSLMTYDGGTTWIGSLTVKNVA